MVENVSNSWILASSLEKIDLESTYQLDTKRYAPSYLPNDEANALPWPDFREQCRPLEVIPLSSDLEALVVPKSITWSDRDLNIYVGSNTRFIRSFFDFSRQDFIDVFQWHIGVCSDLSSDYGETVHCTHGFNPEDSSPDAHSINAKFHTHIHIADKVNRYPLANRELSNFEKLMLIEPFTVLFADYAKSMNTVLIPEWDIVETSDYVSLMTKPKEGGGSQSPIGQVFDLLTVFHTKYSEIEDIYTTGAREDVTGYGRYVPRAQSDRVARCASFVELNRDWLSRASIDLLEYLSLRLQDASPRMSKGSKKIEEPGQLWLAKGLSGAFDLKVSRDIKSLQFNFAPRVVSTSGATKIISDSPTIIRKDYAEASTVEMERMRSYEADVARAALKATRTSFY